MIGICYSRARDDRASAGTGDPHSGFQATRLASFGLGWTVNDPGQIKKMLDCGVDGIITDRPDLVRNVMAEQKMPLPLATPVTP